MSMEVMMDNMQGPDCGMDSSMDQLEPPFEMPGDFENKAAAPVPSGPAQASGKSEPLSQNDAGCGGSDPSPLPDPQTSKEGGQSSSSGDKSGIQSKNGNESSGPSTQSKPPSSEKPPVQQTSPPQQKVSPQQEQSPPPQQPPPTTENTRGAGSDTQADGDANKEPASGAKVETGENGGFEVQNEHASGHQHGQGDPLDPEEMKGIADTLGLPSIPQMQERLDAIGGYNQGQSPEQKVIGANIAQATMAKFTVMPPGNFSTETDASKAYGALKVAGMSGDVDSIRQVVESNGGDLGDLSDKQIIDLWGTNEHHNLHAILFGNEKVYNPAHSTSLNDKDQWQEDGGTDPSTPMGGYNDKGEYPQWGWFDDAKAFNAQFT